MISPRGGRTCLSEWTWGYPGSTPSWTRGKGKPYPKWPANCSGLPEALERGRGEAGVSGSHHPEPELAIPHGV